MNYSNSTTVELHCYNKELVVAVDYNYSYDPGIYTHSNGDPGEPPSEEFEITAVADEEGNDLEPMFDRMDKLFRGKKGYTSIWDRVADAVGPEPPEPDFD